MRFTVHHQLRVLFGFALALSITLGSHVTLAEQSDPNLQPQQTEASSAQPVWRPHTFELQNGLQVVVLPDHRAPVVTHMVWYRVGAADEPPGKSGIAHFLEHLMFRGSKTIAPGEFSKIVAKNGGQDNAFTSQDYTAYFQRVAVDRLPLVMQLESDRMRGLVLTDDVVLPERDVILEERSTRTDNSPQSLLTEQISASLFLAHPYRIPIIGWEHEMRELSREDAITFYRQHYAPNNAILIVAGDVTEESVRPLAEKFYGEIETQEIQPRKRPTEPPAIAPRRIEYKDARVKQPSFRRAYIAASYATSTERTAESLDLLMQIFGSGPTSRLYTSLVVEQGLAANASAWYSGTALDYGRVGIYAEPRPGVTLEQLEEAVDAEIDKLLSEGVTEDELARAQFNIVADFDFARDSQQSMAQLFGTALTTGSTIESVVEYPAKIKEVTRDDISSVAQSLFESESQVTAYLLPEEAS